MNARAASRSCRPSIRPSAFGIPRTRGSDPSEITTAVERLSAPSRAALAEEQPAPPEAGSEAPSDTPPVVSQVVRKRAVAPRPAVKTDIEELLPISQGVKSLPLPPKFPAQEAPPTTRRFPWMSLSIFAVVLAGSLATLARYRGERTQVVALHAPSTVDVDWSSLTPLARGGSHGPWSSLSGASETLLDAGEHALAAGDPGSAQEEFVLALGTPRAAFGLARARLAQGDLPGARAWAEWAMQQKPDEQRYRAFLAQLSKPIGTR